MKLYYCHKLGIRDSRENNVYTANNPVNQKTMQRRMLNVKCADIATRHNS